jgi:lambda family phage minor tail protein L
MTIEQDILKPVVPAYIELFDIDLTNTNIPALSGTILRYTPARASTATIGFGTGITYTPFPIEITGISQNTDAAPARPQLAISNISKYIGSLLFLYDGLIGATVVYTRTFEPYLNLSTRLSLPPIKYILSQKLVHNKKIITFELRNPRDKDRAYMPRRQMLTRDFPGLGVNKNVR